MHMSFDPVGYFTCLSRSIRLPKILNFIIAETHKWFANSAVIQSKYRNLYKALNDGANPLKILRDCQTRWLTIQPAVKRILGQWLELTTLFSITRHSDKCYTSELLYEMYYDEKNLLYFLFLNPVLIEVQQVNKLFEAKSVDKVKLLNELILVITSIGKKIVLPTSNINILTTKMDDFLNPKPYLGYQFETKVAEMKSQSTFINTEENDIRIRCSNFLIALSTLYPLRDSGFDLLVRRSFYRILYRAFYCAL